MKINMLIFLLLIWIISSCNEEPKIINQKIDVYKDNFKTGVKNIDSLKELSIKAGLSGNLKEMKALCESVYKIDSLDADNLSRLSAICVLEGNYAKGLEYINKSIKIDTALYLKHNYTFKALLFYELKDKDSSGFYFKKMLEYNKNNAESISALAEFFNQYRHFDKAIEYNDIAYKYYPNDLKVNFYKANIYVYQKKYNEALIIFNKMQPKVNDDPNFYFSRGACYLYMKEYNKALKDIEVAKKLNSEDIRFITATARIYQKMGNYKESEKNYKIAMAKGDTMAVRLYNSLLEDMKK